MKSSYKIALAKAAITILRPLIRVLIRNEFTHAELSELVRQTYVEVAYDAFSIPGQKMTFSRAAVLTGLSRKEVVRLRAVVEADELSFKHAPNRATRVVHGWLSDKEFLDKNKKPLKLPLKGKQGSFESLVMKFSGDITYGAVLDELNRIGVTEQPTNDTVSLLSYGYVPKADELEKIRIMAICVADIFGTAVYNIDAPAEDRRFQRQIVYTGITDELANEFRHTSAERAEELLQELNAMLAEGRSASAGTEDEAAKRIGLGIYYFQEDVGSKPD